MSLNGRVRDPVENAVEERKSADQADPRRTEKGPPRIDLLDRAKTPSRPLGDILVEAFRREAHAEHLVEEYGAIAVLFELEGREHVLRDGFDGHPARRNESIDPKNG